MFLCMFENLEKLGKWQYWPKCPRKDWATLGKLLMCNIIKISLLYTVYSFYCACRTCDVFDSTANRPKKWFHVPSNANKADTFSVRHILTYFHTSLQPKVSTKHLQLVQNTAASKIFITCRSNAFDRSTQILSFALPISTRADIKFHLLNFKSLHGLAPSYLSNLLRLYVPAHKLCSLVVAYSCSMTINKQSVGSRGSILTPCFVSLTCFPTFAAISIIIF